MNPSFNVVDFAIQLAVILFAISFHESAHAWVALRFGDPTARDLGRISLNPIRHIDPFGSVILPILLYFTSGLLFGYAKPTPVNLGRTKNPRLADLAVSGAGPLSNLVLAFVGVLGMLGLRSAGPLLGPTIFPPLWQVGSKFVEINVSLGLFNLIPIPPLDGSWVLAAAFGEKVRLFFQQVGRYGFLILLVLSYTGILSRFLSPVIGGIFRMINGLFA